MRAYVGVGGGGEGCNKSEGTMRATVGRIQGSERGCCGKTTRVWAEMEEEEEGRNRGRKYT